MSEGYVLVDKPAGISSFAALFPAKRAAETRRVGHTGTLDPFATGVLIGLVGRATKFARWFDRFPKRYVATVQLGVETDTLDLDGVEIARAPLVSVDKIVQKRANFLGSIEQTPPRHSAIRIDGRRAYERARKGELFDVPTRTVHVEALDVLPLSDDRFELSVTCSTGTYIRSLARDLCREAGSVGHLTALRRTAIGEFLAADSVAPGELTRNDIRPISELIDSLRVFTPVEISDQVVRMVSNGVPLRDSMVSDSDIGNGEYAFRDSDGNCVAIVEKREGRWKYLISLAQ